MASEVEMGIGGSNPNPSSNPNYDSSSEREIKCKSKRWGERELDAARALADFAQMAKISRESGERGRGSRKRIKKGSQAGACGESSQDFNNSRTEHATNLVDDDPQDNKASEVLVGEGIKVEQCSELAISDNSCPSSHVSCFGHKMKQNMTEDEREARRIRRVLANRESARQTIRRRQALREELIKRAADLSLENKNIKMEKELVMKEYLSLKDRNKELKEQMVKARKYEVEAGTEITLRHVETSTSPSTELSLVAPNGHSSTAWAPWPPVSSDVAACFEGGVSSGAGASRTLFYVQPCAWFFPSLHQTSESYPPCCQASTDKGVHFLANQHDFRHFPELGEKLERASLHVGRKTDVPLREEVAIEAVKNTGINLEEMPVGFDGHDKISEHDPRLVLTSSYEIVNPCQDVNGKQEIGVKVDRIPDRHGNAVGERSQAASIPPLTKLVDPTAAAAARRRRKELTKLKYPHVKQIRLYG